jgi:uncharacterized protein
VIVVSNTSPLTNLGGIGRLSLLQRLFSTIHIPRSVVAELHADHKSWPGAREVADAAWIVKHEVANSPLLKSLQQHLGPGESGAIALALEMGADLILLDDQDARLAAESFELRLTGVCGLLLLAKSRGEIERVEPELEKLRNLGFYLGDKTLLHVLDLAGETRGLS